MLNIKNKKGGIVLIEAFLAIFVLFTFFIIFMNVSQREDFVYTSDYEIAKEIFNDQDLRDCFDSLDYGCYEEMSDCLGKIREYYMEELIVCIMNENIYPELPQSEISSFRLYKSLKEGIFSPYEVGLFLIKNN